MKDYPLSAATDNIRPLLASGHFFPREKEKLSSRLAELAAAALPTEPVRAAAAMVPHGALRYAGSGLSWALQQLSLSFSSTGTIVLIAQVHREEEEAIWLPDYSGFHTPFGILPVPREKLDMIADMGGVFRLGRIPFEEEPCFDLILSALGNLKFSGTVLPVLFGSAGDSLVEYGINLFEKLGPDNLPLISANFLHDPKNGTIHGQCGINLLNLLNIHFHAAPGRWYHGEEPQYCAAIWPESDGTTAGEIK